ncbi:MAG: hypothetical protein ACXVAY_01435 [Mucilaginibacter sp.]
MAGIYPELWLSRVDNKLKVGDEAPWLDGIAEINAPLQITEGGSLSEQNAFHIPKTDLDIDILINNNVLPIPVQNYADGVITVYLEKYQTKQMPISDDQAMGSSYKQIDNVTQLMVQQLRIKKFSRAIWNIAPAGDTDATPILTTTGRSGEYDKDGNEIIWKDGDRLRLTYADIVDHRKQYDINKVPMIGRRLVLCSDHASDLLFDRRRFGDLLNSMTAGTTAPMIAGFKIYQYLVNPVYLGTVKQAFEAVADDTHLQASVSFYESNIAVKTGMTRQYYKPANIDTDNQSNTLAYRHYFMATPKRNQYIGGIVSGIAA